MHLQREINSRGCACSNSDKKIIQLYMLGKKDRTSFWWIVSHFKHFFPAYFVFRITINPKNNNICCMHRHLTGLVKLFTCEFLTLPTIKYCLPVFSSCILRCIASSCAPKWRMLISTLSPKLCLLVQLMTFPVIPLMSYMSAIPFCADSIDFPTAGYG